MEYRNNYDNARKTAIVGLLRRNHITYWMLADVMHVHENTVYRMMRNPSQEQAAEIERAARACIEGGKDA